MKHIDIDKMIEFNEQLMNNLSAFEEICVSENDIIHCRTIKALTRSLLLILRCKDVTLSDESIVKKYDYLLTEYGILIEKLS